MLYVCVRGVMDVVFCLGWSAWTRVWKGGVVLCLCVL